MGIIKQWYNTYTFKNVIFQTSIVNKNTKIKLRKRKKRLMSIGDV